MALPPEQQLNAIAVEAFGLELHEARDAGSIGYMARVLVQATFPHTARKEPYLERSNGDLTLTVFAPPSVGLPYGSPPRHILAWVTTEAVRTRTPELVLGECYGTWLRKLGVQYGGQQYRNYQRAALSLFASTISCTVIHEAGASFAGVQIARRAALWWNPKSPEQLGLWESTVTLSDDFFQAVIDRPVPLDLPTLRALSRSPLALDLYTWLTYRMSYLRKPTLIPWEALQAQFGADYHRSIDFRRKVIAALQKVVRFYPTARVAAETSGIRLLPSPPHVAARERPARLSPAS